MKTCSGLVLFEKLNVAHVQMQRIPIIAPKAYRLKLLFMIE